MACPLPLSNHLDYQKLKFGLITSDYQPVYLDLLAAGLRAIIDLGLGVARERQNNTIMHATVASSSPTSNNSS